MIWTEPTECALCGEKGRDIHRQLVEWRVAPPGMRYEHVDRCDDRAACRKRVEDSIGPWPLAERKSV